MIDIDVAVTYDKSQYFCPDCNGEVIIKNGITNSSHFTHRMLNDCDTFTQDMSDWHKEWQKRFPLKNREVGLPQKRPIHRADVLAYGFVIEFQHSKITRDEFNSRNEFYTSLGKKVIWIFDMREVIDSGRMECYGDVNGGGKWEWKHAWKVFSDWNPAYDKDIIIFFQTSDYNFNDEDGDGHIERVVWVADSISYMSKFITSYKIGNLTELLSYMSLEYNRKKYTTK